MKKRRIAWTGIILAAAIAYLFSNGTVTLAMLVAAISFPVASAVLFSVSGRKLDVNIYAGQDEANGHLLIRLNCQNNSVIPIAMAETVTDIKNLRTGEWIQSKGSAYISGKSEETVTVNLTAAHIGRHDICLDEIYIYDALQLFRKKMNTSLKHSFVLGPREFEMSLRFGSSSSSILESDKYSRIMQGNDPGEVRSIREYVPGDPVRNIHWKLSEKTDKVLVKELSLPVTDDLLIILDSVKEDTGYESMDACASVYASLIKAALDEDMSFSIGWMDPDSRRPEVRKISDKIQASLAAEEYLAVPARKDDSKYNDHHSGKVPGKGGSASSMRYAYIVTVGAVVPSDISNMASVSSITALICDASGLMNIEGIKVTGFDAKDYEQSLASIAI